MGSEGKRANFAGLGKPVLIIRKMALEVRVTPFHAHYVNRTGKCKTYPASLSDKNTTVNTLIPGCTSSCN